MISDDDAAQCHEKTKKLSRIKKHKVYSMFNVKVTFISSNNYLVFD